MEKHMVGGTEISQTLFLVYVKYGSFLFLDVHVL